MLFGWLGNKKEHVKQQEKEVEELKNRFYEWLEEQEETDSTASLPSTVGDVDLSQLSEEDLEYIRLNYEERLKEIDMEMGSTGLNYNTYQKEDLHDDLQILDYYIEYDKNNEAKYLMFNLRVKEEGEEEWTEMWKAVKLLRLVGIPRMFREEETLLTTWDDVLIGMHDADVNFITLMANILKPERIGLVYCYGVQAIAETPEESQRKADNAYAGLAQSLMANFPQIEYRLLSRKEADWIDRQMREMKHLLMLRGIPRVRKSAGMGTTNMMGGVSSNTKSEEQNEEFLRGMSETEYLLLLLTSPVSFGDLQRWLTITSRELSKYKGEMAGTRGLSAGISLPVVFMGNLGSAFGKNFGESNTFGHAIGLSEADSTGLSSSTGVSDSVSSSHSEGLSNSVSISQGQSHTDSLSESQGLSYSEGKSFTDGYSSTTGVSSSEGVSHTVGNSYTQGISEGVSSTHSVGTSSSVSESISQGVSYSEGTSYTKGTSESYGTSSSVGQSSSVGSSVGQSTSESFSNSVSNGVSNSTSQSSSTSQGVSQGTSTGTSFSQSFGTSFSVGTSESIGTSQSIGVSNSVGSSHVMGHSQTSTTSESHGTSETVGSSNSWGVSNSTSSSWSNSQGTSNSTSSSSGGSYSESNSVSSGTSSSTSTGVSIGNSYSQGTSESYGSSQSTGVSYGHNVGTSSSASQSTSVGTSVGYSVGYNSGTNIGGSAGIFGVGVSGSDSWGESTGWSFGTSYGESTGVSNGSSEGWSQGYSGGISQSHSNGLSESVGMTSGTSYSSGSSTSNSVSSGVSQGSSWSNGTSTGTSESTSVGGGSSSGTSESQGISFSSGVSNSWGSSSANAISENYGISESSGTSMSQGTSTSHGTSTSQGTSSSYGTGYSEGTSTSTSLSNSVSTGTSTGTSSSVSQSQGFGLSNSTSQSVSNGISSSEGISQSQGSSESYGVSSSVSNSYGKSTGVSNGVSEGWSEGVSRGTSESYGISVSDGISQTVGVSSSLGHSVSEGSSATKGTSTSVGKSTADGVSVGQSQGMGTSVSDSVGISKGVSTSEGITSSKSTGRTESETTALGLTSGSSNTISTGSSSSMGLGPSLSYTKSAQWYDENKANIVKVLDEQRNRLMSAIRQGAFYVDIYILTPDEKAKKAASILASSAWYGDVWPSPIQIVEPDPVWAEHLMAHASVFSACTAVEDAIELMEGYKFSTILLPEEMSAYCHPPRFEGGDMITVHEAIPFFRLPGKMEGEAFLGYCISTETGVVTDIEFKLGKKHMMHTLITGASGSGKTVTSLRFISELVNKMGFGATILDWKDDWRSLMYVVPREKFLFYSTGTTPVNKLQFNPIAIPKGVDVDLWMDSVVEAFVLGFGLGQRGYEIMWRNLGRLYSKHGVWKNPERSINLTMLDLYNEIGGEIADKGQKKQAGFGDVEAYNRVLARMGYFTNEDSRLYGMFGNPENPVPVENLCTPGKVIVLEAQGMKGPQKSFLLGLVSSGIFQVARVKDENGVQRFVNQPHMIVFEEAHQVVKGTDTAGGDSGTGVTEESTYEVMWNEARSAGLYMVALAQMPTHLPTSVLANTRIYITHQLGNDEDIDFITRRMIRDPKLEHKDFARFIERIPLGYAIIQIRRIDKHYNAEPILAKIEMIEAPRPSDEQLRRHMIEIQGFEL